ncbi:hypothetical protein B566_EDAN014792, partial [Ephemera danica]
MNNAVYGKIMENVRKIMQLELVMDSQRLAKCIASMYFKDRVMYSENMSAVHFHKKKVVLDKTTYVGMAILNKTLMYDFHYETMVPMYGNKLSLLYMDTDSFVYEIRTDDFYKDMETFSHRMDTSDYPKGHQLYSETNKRVLGMFKNEANSAIVTEFVGLRTKMYSIVYGGKTTKKAKGVKSSALQKHITLLDYKRCLFKDESKYTTYRSFKSHHHKIRTEHIPISCGFYVVSTLSPEVTTGIPLDYKTFEGENTTKQLLDALEDISKKVNKLYRRKEPMQLTRDDWRDFHSSTICYFCLKPFTDNDRKVRDHCHITAKYRGAAHSSCNLRAQNPHFIPVLAHNMSGYDSKFLINELEHTPGVTHVVPNTEENFIAFPKKPEDGLHLLFLDSLRFMSSSLDNLVKNLPTEKMAHLNKMFPDDEQRKLMSRKGVFCYDYLDDLDKLNETCLPPKEAFESKLTESSISDADYQHAQNVWRTGKCKTLRDYMVIYLKADVALLTDVFEEFRTVCLNAYELDLCWYYTAPSFARDAAMKYTGVKLDLIQDLEIIKMVERGIRGGVAQCTKRYAEATNKYTSRKPDPRCESNFIAYLDANNLYGWTMCHALPTGNFKLTRLNVEIEEFDIEKLKKMKKDDCRGCILEVDVEYPGALHDNHSDFPFLRENKVPPGGKHSKLVTTLDEKKNYVIHYLALQQAIAHGLKVTYAYSILEFDQSPFLKPYIDLNTEMRKKASNNFEKDFFKLMKNAVYGKIMEIVRKRMHLELVMDSKRLAKCIASMYFKDRVIYSENMSAVHFHKKKVVLDKPTYVGMAILDISKTLMYDFHYETMVPMYGEACEDEFERQFGFKLISLQKEFSIRPVLPTTGPLGVQQRNYPGQQKWNPFEEPDTQLANFDCLCSSTEIEAFLFQLRHIMQDNLPTELTNQQLQIHALQLLCEGDAKDLSVVDFPIPAGPQTVFNISELNLSTRRAEGEILKRASAKSTYLYERQLVCYHALRSSPLPQYCTLLMPCEVDFLDHRHRLQFDSR